MRKIVTVNRSSSFPQRPGRGGIPDSIPGNQPDHTHNGTAGGNNMYRPQAYETGYPTTEQPVNQHQFPAPGGSQEWGPSFQAIHPRHSKHTPQPAQTPGFSGQEPRPTNPFHGNYKNTTQNFIPHDSVLNTKPQRSGVIKRKIKEINFNFLDPSRQGKIYRYDVDGLRGFACLLVAVFHIWIRRTSGGVDVFLTVSGYFFLPSLFRKISKPRYRLGDFNPIQNLKNILKRLWPAMIVVLFAIFIIGWRVMLHTERLPMLKQIPASIGFYENWYMYVTGSSYLTAGASVSPLQHMWSMAIQGQFFIATIIFVFLVGWIIRFAFRNSPLQGAKIALWTMITLSTLIAAVSFVYAAHAMKIDPNTGYYHTLARIWEPLFGGLIGIFGTSIVLPRVVRELMSVTAIVAIAVIGSLIVGTLEFPGPWALVPVLSALAFIMAYNPQHAPTSMPIMNQIFSGKIVQWFGRISYPLYLWHWPLLILFMNWRSWISAPNFIQGTSILVISIGLAWLTATFVENPLRSTKKIPFPIASRAAKTGDGFLNKELSIKGLPAAVLYRLDQLYKPAISLILAAFLVIMGQAYRSWNTEMQRDSVIVPTPPNLYPGAEALLSHVPVPDAPIQPPLEAALTGDNPETTPECIMNFSQGEDENNPLTCEYGDTSAKRLVVLAGGSHAEHWISALDPIAQEQHFKIITILRMGCELTSDPKPTKMLAGNPPYPACAQWEKDAIKKIIDLKPDYLFTTVTRPYKNQGDFVPPNYIDAFKELSDAGINILGMRDTPWPHHFFHGSLQPPFACMEQLNDPWKCGAVYHESLSPVNPAIKALQQFPNIKLLDMSRGLCVPERDYCPAVVGNLLVWHDAHHLGRHFVFSLKKEIERQMGPITGWWKPPARTEPPSAPPAPPAATAPPSAPPAPKK